MSEWQIPGQVKVHYLGYHTRYDTWDAQEEEGPPFWGQRVDVLSCNMMFSNSIFGAIFGPFLARPTHKLGGHSCVLRGRGNTIEVCR